MAINIRKLPLIVSIPCCLSHRTGLISASCPRDILCSKKFNLESSVTLSPHIPLVSFILEQFTSLSLTFITLILLKIKGILIKCFLKCPSVWICLIFSHNYIQIIHFGAEKYDISDVYFLLHPIEWYIISIWSITGNVYLLIKVFSANSFPPTVIPFLFEVNK